MSSSVLLEKTRKLNKLIQKSTSKIVVFSDICDVLADVLGANVVIMGKSAKILGISEEKNGRTYLYNDLITGDFIEENTNKELLNIKETQSNLDGNNGIFNISESSNIVEKIYVTIVPISGGGERLCTLVLYRKTKEFTDEDLILAEYGSTVVGMEVLRTEHEKNELEIRKRAIVQLAIGTLSYSELEAIVHIFKELEGDEGLLVASKIADRVGITRSVIVNALRKFESAGLIEARSLGMKGTHIKILNEKLMEELRKINGKN